MGYDKKRTEQKDLQGEQWRALTCVPQSRGKYYVSDFGRYKSQQKNGKWYYSIGAKKSGYYCMSICYKGKKIGEFYMHDLVAQAFIGPMSDNEIVHHKNRDKHDNRLENLKIQTSSQHAHHHRLGTKQSQQTKAKIGEANAWRKDPKSGKFRKKEDVLKKKKGKK